MDKKQMEEYLQMAEKRGIGPDGKFYFRCTACGKCCTHRDDVLMSPDDIYRASKHLGMRTVDFCKQFCTCHMGPDSLLPIMSPIMKGRIEKCVFLENKKCAIHAAKPSVCELYPLGRLRKPEEGKVIYFMQPMDCGKKDEAHTPREWLSTTGLERSESVSLLWAEAITEMTRRMRGMFLETCDERRLYVRDVLYRLILFRMYLNYDTDKEFVPQFKENLNAVREAMGEAEEMLNAAK